MRFTRRAPGRGAIAMMRWGGSKELTNPTAWLSVMPMMNWAKSGKSSRAMPRVLRTGCPIAAVRRGRILGIVHADGSEWSYAYDARGRLTQAVRRHADGAVAWRGEYAYDPADNLVLKAAAGPEGSETSRFEYTPGNVLKSELRGGTETLFDYDAWGRMTEKRRGNFAASYTWGYGDKLVRAVSTFPGEGWVEYEYRGDGRPYSQRTAQGRIRYGWDAACNLLSTEDDAGRCEKRFVQAYPGEVAAQPLAESQGGWRVGLLLPRPFGNASRTLR